MTLAVGDSVSRKSLAIRPEFGDTASDNIFKNRFGVAWEALFIPLHRPVNYSLSYSDSFLYKYILHMHVSGYLEFNDLFQDR